MFFDIRPFTVRLRNLPETFRKLPESSCKVLERSREVLEHSRKVLEHSRKVLERSRKVYVRFRKPYGSFHKPSGIKLTAYGNCGSELTAYGPGLTLPTETLGRCPAADTPKPAQGEGQGPEDHVDLGMCVTLGRGVCPFSLVNSAFLKFNFSFTFQLLLEFHNVAYPPDRFKRPPCVIWHTLNICKFSQVNQLCSNSKTFYK